jgi:ABC-type polysaccharide/polyol phosphate export permease
MAVMSRTIPMPYGGRNAARVIERNVMVYRRTWMILFSGFFEPLFYLLSLGFGLGGLIGTVDGFIVVMFLLGLVSSPTAILAAPASLLIGFAAAGLGTAATSFVRKWQDFDLVFVITLPLFLFSGTFFPITVYPQPLRTLVEFSPLYRGVHLLRSLTTGTIDPTLIAIDVLYLIVLGLIGLTITSRRLGHLLLK